jgi:hypothetical protein
VKYKHQPVKLTALLGTFSVSRHKIKKCNLAFKPSKNIQKALKEAQFLKKRK